jgi:hypothetical protein
MINLLSAIRKKIRPNKAIGCSRQSQQNIPLEALERGKQEVKEFYSFWI